MILLQYKTESQPCLATPSVTIAHERGNSSSTVGLTCEVKISQAQFKKKTIIYANSTIFSFNFNKFCGLKGLMD